VDKMSIFNQVHRPRTVVFLLVFICVVLKPLLVSRK